MPTACAETSHHETTGSTHSIARTLGKTAGGASRQGQGVWSFSCNSSPVRALAGAPLPQQTEGQQTSPSWSAIRVIQNHLVGVL
mmetsp:Transcript_7628/g.10991  ORF Transcript_7628/g.10991 Transcript_7628/m.10991 type:complete len:84 (-) Transcript_7628:234-485(-)